MKIQITESQLRQIIIEEIEAEIQEMLDEGAGDWAEWLMPGSSAWKMRQAIQAIDSGEDPKEPRDPKKIKKKDELDIEMPSQEEIEGALKDPEARGATPHGHTGRGQLPFRERLRELIGQMHRKYGQATPEFEVPGTDLPMGTVYSPARDAKDPASRDTPLHDSLLVDQGTRAEDLWFLANPYVEIIAVSEDDLVTWAYLVHHAGGKLKGSETKIFNPVYYSSREHNNAWVPIERNSNFDHVLSLEARAQRRKAHARRGAPPSSPTSTSATKPRSWQEYVPTIQPPKGAGRRPGASGETGWGKISPSRLPELKNIIYQELIREIIREATLKSLKENRK